jgi:hypothetical protein
MKSVLRLGIVSILLVLLVGCAPVTTIQDCPSWTGKEGKCYVQTRIITGSYRLEANNWDVARIVISSRYTVRKNNEIEIRNIDKEFIDLESTVLGNGEYFIKNWRKGENVNFITFDHVAGEETAGWISFEFCNFIIE